MTTLGKLRHLSQTSTPAGHFCVLAIDHRANLWEDLERHSDTPLDDAAFMAFKRQIIRDLAPAASALLTDPAYGFGPGIASGDIGGHIGLLSPLEVTDYSLHPSRRALRFMPNWSVEKIKRVGASGVKLLIYYHPAAPGAAGLRETVAGVVEQCARHDIPLFLEPIPYALDENMPLDNIEMRQVAVETARTFSTMSVDVLKLPFPIDVKHERDETVWRAALAELDAACGVPWALLSGGVDYETFYRQSELACEAGASGVIVGRAVWAEAVKLQGAARADFIGITARERMQNLATLCARSARSWRERVAAPELGLDWHERY
jgi:tagatose-1,6-bisphosphate aldolase